MTLEMCGTADDGPLDCTRELCHNLNHDVRLKVSESGMY